MASFQMMHILQNVLTAFKPLSASGFLALETYVGYYIIRLN